MWSHSMMDNIGNSWFRTGEAKRLYREVTGSNPVEVLNFSGFSTQLHKLRS